MMVPSEKVITLSPDDSLEEAARRLSDARVGGAPVVTGPDRKVVGVLSESDILRFVEKSEKRGKTSMAALERAAPTKVSSLMSKEVVTVGREAGLDEVVRLMVTKQVNRVVVVDKRMALRGLIARADALRAAQGL